MQLCTVLIANPNFLVLDEPTNDLDIPTLQVLEEYLAEFNGCLLIVSHDRYFMDRLTEHLFVLEGDGSVRDFPGNFTTYRPHQKRGGKGSLHREKLPPNPLPHHAHTKRKRSVPTRRSKSSKHPEAEIPLLEEH